MPENPSNPPLPETSRQVVWQPECNKGWIVDGKIPALWLDQLRSDIPCTVLINLNGIAGLDSNGLRMLQKMVNAARDHNARQVCVMPGSDSMRQMLWFANFDLVTDLEEVPS